MRRLALVALIALAVGLVPADARAQVGVRLVITMQVDGTVLAPGGSYYVAFSTDRSLLGGPRPDSTGWTHYLLVRGGQFYFGTIPPDRLGPYGFEQVRPPVPWPFGQVLSNGKGVQVTINTLDLTAAGQPPVTSLKVNFVTVGDRRVQVDALGPGNNDPVGFVTFDVRRDLFVPITDPRGDETPRNPNLDIIGGEIRIGLP